MQYIAPGVRVQDDFFTHLHGKWLATAEIPADKSSWGSFAKLRDDTTPQLRGIIEATQQDKDKKAGSEAQKIGDLYASYMDEAKLDALGTKPLAGELNRIRSLRDKKGVLDIDRYLAQYGLGGKQVFYYNHHAAHALGTLFHTDWDDALIYTSDGGGDFAYYSARRLKDGKLAEMYRNPNYTGITTEFWGSCDAVGGREDWTVWGTPNCGKGQPGQVARVGHGASPARFRNVQLGVKG